MSEARDRDTAVEQWLRHLSTGVTDLPPSEACLNAETMGAIVVSNPAMPK